MSEMLLQSDHPNNLFVRAHHIKFFMMYERGSSPEQIAKLAVASADIGWYDTADLSVLDSAEPVDEVNGQAFSSAYRIDVLGKNKENTSRFQEGASTLIDKYVAIEPSTPVIFGVNVLDSVCQGCAFQRHCRNVNPERTLTDRAAIKMFSRVALDLGYGDQMAGTETLLRTDGETTQAVARQLAANVDSLDAALSNMAFTGNPLVGLSFSRNHTTPE